MNAEKRPTPDPDEEGLNHLERLNESLKSLMGPDRVIMSPQKKPREGGPGNLKFTFIPRDRNSDASG